MGGVWEVIKEGIFLEATEDNTKVGTEIEAGAPNITGTYDRVQCYKQGGGTGAFTGSNYTQTAAWTGNINGCYILNFDASKSNPIYGKSDTIQPHAIKCKFHRRIG